MDQNKSFLKISKYLILYDRKVFYILHDYFLNFKTIENMQKLAYLAEKNHLKFFVCSGIRTWVRSG